MILSLTLALREMRSGVKGFGIFLACLALGVAALAAAGSTSEAFRHGLAAQSRDILGGDIAVSVEGRRFAPDEQAAFRRLGKTSDRLHVRAMAGGSDPSGDRRLVEVSGIDAAYPLAGTVDLRGAGTLEAATAPSGGIPGAAVAPELLSRLHLRLGDTLLIGDTPFRVRAVIVKEPDTLARGFALGPRVIVSDAALLASGILRGDALFGEAVTIAVPDQADRALTQLKAAFPKAGFTAKGRRDALSGLGRLIDQLEFFLSFIGLASLLTGGLGIASAVSAYLSDRRPAIAVLKAVGADGALIRNLYLIQLGALTAFGIVIGLVIGAATPFALGAIAGGDLPLPLAFAVYPAPLAKAAALGFLAAAVFSLAPLARARATSPASLFRKDAVVRIPFGPEMAAMIVCAIGLIGLSAITAPSPVFAAIMLLALVAGFGVLWGVGQGVTWLAARLRHLCTGAVRIGLANLSGPRSAARTAAPSMGFGIALLTTIILIQSSLLAQVTTSAGKTAPSLIFTQIAPENAVAFDHILAAGMGGLNAGNYRRYPFATGRISAINGVAVDPQKIAPNVRWAFDQDLTLSALNAAPPEASLDRGHWWATGYNGPPQAIIAEDIARGANIAVGEPITISVLGRDLDVTVAGTRKIDFGRFGANFPIILDAAALDGANLRNIAIARTTKLQDEAIIRQVGAAFPEINIVSVREQLDAAAVIFDQIGWAIRAAAGVAAAASVLVLIGAIAANAQARAREAAILKVLGSSRAFIITTYCVEYGAIGLIAGITGVALGIAAAAPVIIFGLHATFSADWTAIAAALVSLIVAGAVCGGIAALAALSRRPASALRSAG